MKKEDILKKIGFQKLISTPLIEDVIIYSIDKGEEELVYEQSDGYAWYILRGETKVTHYLEDGREFFLKYGSGEWMGLKEAILGTYIIRDFKAYTDVTAVAVPIKKIMNKCATPDILKEIIKIMASFSEVEEEEKLSRIAYRNEEYLLKVLEENNYELSYSNQRDFSNILNINTRTLQRIIKNLVDKKIITRERKKIYVSDIEAFKRYREKITT